MAHLEVVCQDGMYHMTSQDVFFQFPHTDANKKVLCLFLRALQTPDTGKAFFTHEHVAQAFGDKARQNTQHVDQELKHCGGDLLAYLQRKRTIDSSVVAAVSEVLRQRPLDSAPQLCELVSARLGRTDLTPANIRTAMKEVPCTVIRPVLHTQWEQGTFHPKEDVVLEKALAALLQTPSSAPSSVTNTLLALGVTPAVPDEAAAIQRQQADAVPVLLNPQATVAQLPANIHVMVLAFT